jgi:transcriptional regulator with XRE-family HTH domain
MAVKSAKVAQVEGRRSAVLQYRCAGLSLRQIADRVGVSHTQVAKDLQAALTELRADMVDMATDLKAIESERLDRARVALWARVCAGDLAAIDRWIRLSESFRRLHGLDAPLKVAETDPEGAPRNPVPLDLRLARIQAMMELAAQRREKSLKTRRAAPAEDEPGGRW